MEKRALEKMGTLVYKKESPQGHHLASKAVVTHKNTLLSSC
jgi:hypothetical protein